MEQQEAQAQQRPPVNRDQALVEILTALVEGSRQQLRAANAAEAARDAAVRERERRLIGLNNQEFMKGCPVFERGKIRWSHFVKTFQELHLDYPAQDNVAKRALFRAIRGQAAILITSMAPSQGIYANMTLDEYLTAVGEKFAPASESEQMKGEYLRRRQGKLEDVQTYLNEKHELFKLTYPNAGERREDLADFFDEATKGIANDNVRYSLWECRPDTIAAFVEKAIFLVSVERKRIEYGGSRAGSSMDGLNPVSRVMRPTMLMGEPMEIDHMQETDELGAECECAAIHERGIRGPCYFCQKQGHILRNCPRKSAGLPKIYPAKSQGRANPKGNYPRPQSTSQGAQGNNGRGNGRNRFGRRVNNLDEEEPGEEAGDEDEPEEGPAEEEAEDVSFLEERYL